MQYFSTPLQVPQGSLLAAEKVGASGAERQLETVLIERAGRVTIQAQ
jgi:hypothetical protein